MALPSQEGIPNDNQSISANPHFINAFPDLQALFDELKEAIGDRAFVEFVKAYQYGPSLAPTN